MLREKNIEERDAFFKTIDQDIKRMSGMDLSKQQNVDSASGIFNQMLDNKGIVKDMVWTKNWQKQHQRADGFRNCVDPEKCGGMAWEGGVNALNYMADEFKNATDEEAQSFGAARYTPAQDVMGKAIKLAKEADLNITVDQRSGGYIVTTKNGPNLLARPLAQLFSGTLGKDPAIMEYYKTKAYVDRKGWIASKTPELGSREAAEQAYIQEMTQTVGPKLNESEKNIKSVQENVSNQRKNLEDEIRTRGTQPNSTLAEIYRQSVGTEEELNNSADVIKDASGNMAVGLSNAGTRAAMANLDAARAASYLQGDINNAAMVLANKDSSQTMRVDPYAMEGTRQANRLILEDRKDIRMIKKFELGQLAKKKEARGGVLANEGWKVPAGKGSASVNLAEDAALTEYEDVYSDAVDAVSVNEKQMLKEAFKIVQLEAKNSSATKSAGAQTDLLAMGDAMIQEAKKNDPAFLRKYASYTDEQKLNVLKDYNFDNEIKKMSGTMADDLYTNVLNPMMDQGTPSNRVNRKYFSNLWSGTSNRTKRDIIKRKSVMLDHLDASNRTKVAQVKADVLSKSGGFAEYADDFDIFIDDNGIAKPREQFVKDYVEQAMGEQPEHNNPTALRQYATDQAMEIYNNMDDENDGIMTHWREAYSSLALATGQTNLSGGGSQAVAEGRGYLADPVEFQGTATFGFMGSSRDVFSAGPEGARVSMGAMGNQLPEESNEDAMAVLRQLYTDMATKTSPEDKTRPVLNIVTQDIAGGNSEWMAVNVKVDDRYAKQYVGSKNNEGLMYDNRVALQEDGITMYIKKSSATNQFYKNSKSSDVENILHYTGEYEIDDYPEEFQGSLKKNDDSWTLSGIAQTGVDKQGNPIQKSFVQEYYNMNTNADKIVNDFREKFLIPTVAGVRNDMTAYNIQHGIKDPQALLNKQ
jgi:hypothetical protein